MYQPSTEMQLKSYQIITPSENQVDFKASQVIRFTIPRSIGFFDAHLSKVQFLVKTENANCKMVFLDDKAGVSSMIDMIRVTQNGKVISEVLEYATLQRVIKTYEESQSVLQKEATAKGLHDDIFSVADSGTGENQVTDSFLLGQAISGSGLVSMDACEAHESKFQLSLDFISLFEMLQVVPMLAMGDILLEIRLVPEDTRIIKALPANGSSHFVSSTPTAADTTLTLSPSFKGFTCAADSPFIVGQQILGHDVGPGAIITGGSTYVTAAGPIATTSNGIGTGLTVATTAVAGAITAVTISAAGDGNYKAGDIVTITGGDVNAQFYLVDRVGVKFNAITAGGTTYTGAAGQATSGGGGTGMLVTTITGGGPGSPVTGVSIDSYGTGGYIAGGTVTITTGTGDATFTLQALASNTITAISQADQTGIVTLTWVGAQDMRSATSTKISFGVAGGAVPTAITQFVVSKAELQLQVVQPPQQYVADQMSQVSSEGLFYDVPAWTTYRDNVYANVKSQTVTIPTTQDRAISFFSLLRSQTAGVWAFDNSTDWSNNGVWADLRYYRSQINGMYYPNQPVDLKKFHGRLHFPQEHVRELEKALKSSGIVPRSLLQLKQNFIMARALGVHGSTMDLTATPINLYLDYQTSAGPVRTDKSGSAGSSSSYDVLSYVNHITRVAITSDGVEVLN